MPAILTKRLSRGQYGWTWEVTHLLQQAMISGYYLIDVDSIWNLNVFLAEDKKH